MAMRELKKELWPYKVSLNSDWKKDITPVKLWLGDQFGTSKNKWKVVQLYSQADFYFKTLEDATLFVLRWT